MFIRLFDLDDVKDFKYVGVDENWVIDFVREYGSKIFGDTVES